MIIQYMYMYMYMYLYMYVILYIYIFIYSIHIYIYNNIEMPESKQTTCFEQTDPWTRIIHPFDKYHGSARDPLVYQNFP